MTDGSAHAYTHEVIPEQLIQRGSQAGKPSGSGREVSRYTSVVLGIVMGVVTVAALIHQTLLAIPAGIVVALFVAIVGLSQPRTGEARTEIMPVPLDLEWLKEGRTCVRGIVTSARSTRPGYMGQPPAVVSQLTLELRAEMAVRTNRGSDFTLASSDGSPIHVLFAQGSHVTAEKSLFAIEHDSEETRKALGVPWPFSGLARSLQVHKDDEIEIWGDEQAPTAGDQLYRDNPAGTIGGSPEKPLLIHVVRRQSSEATAVTE